MSEIDNVLKILPVDQLAAQLGASPEEVAQASRLALPALFGGLQANAMDPAGEASLREALGQHDDALADGQVDLGQVDTRDGEAIASHIFGSQQDEVVNRLGAAGGGAGGGLVRKLIPILAPIVLSYLMKRLQQGGGLGGGAQAPSPDVSRDGGVLPGSGGAGEGVPAPQGAPAPGGSITDILGSILGGGAAPSPGGQPQTAPGEMPSAGSIITDILGGVLGGGRR